MFIVACVSVALARPTELTVRVHDADGAVIPTAAVYLDDEGERHRVNTFDGSLRVTTEYTRTAETPLTVGRQVNIQAVAPGYLPCTLPHAIAHHRDRVDVVLRRLDLSEIGPLGPGPSSDDIASAVGAEAIDHLLALRAVDAMQRWSAAELVATRSGSDDAYGAAAYARAVAAATASEWREHATAASLPTDLATALVVSATGR